jgi:hypothetical protein
MRLGFLVRLALASGDLRLATVVGEVVHDGVTFTGVGELLALSPAGASSDGRVQGMVLTLAGVSPEAIALAEVEPIQRRRVTVWRASFDAEGALTGAEVVFRGVADNVETNDDPASPTVVLSVEPLQFDLQRPRPVYLLPEDQRARWPGDAFFDMVATIQNETLTWGDP